MRADKIRTSIQVAPGPAGFRYFWAKHVTGFNSATHCYNCLKGSPVKAVNLELARGGTISILVEPGAMIYICGVASPHRWPDNFHHAFRAVPGATSEGQLHTGALLKVINGERIPFDGTAAISAFRDRGPEFLTCRNFQFAAQMFGHSDKQSGK